MRNKLILTLCFAFCTNLIFGQNKKELNETISRLQLDSIAQASEIEEYKILFSSLSQELTDFKKLNLDLQEKNRIQAKECKTRNELLRDSIKTLNITLDSIITYSHVSRFIEAFYNSLELSKEENQRHYETGDVEFDSANFSSLIEKDANYSQKRVNLLTDEIYHDRLYINLQSIEDIKFKQDEVLVKVKVMYSAYEMGTFYNDEKLILREHKGLLRLASWYDIDLYKMEIAEYEHMESFTTKDFYNWIGSANKD